MPEAILVADDEPGVRESLGEVLRDAGYSVQTAADGAAAVAALERHDFAVVITDLRMPGADGLAVLRRAREISPKRPGHDRARERRDGRRSAARRGHRLPAQAGRVRRPARQGGIGLRPVWYIGAFALYLRLALRALVDATGDSARILPTAEALVKAIFLDMSLAMDTYIYGGFVERDAAAELERAARVAEEALQVRAEVERLKDDLTNMVVHDLKNPVNGIAMMVQLALRKGRDLPEPQRQYLHHIERTCGEMMRLIQNLLEISKIEEGKMPVAREPIVLAELVDEVAHEYGPVAEQAGRRLRVAVGTDLPPASGDRTLLKRVLVNLVVNALRHSGSSEVVIEGGSAPPDVRLELIDYGHGIAEGDRVRIFEKFRTVRRSPSDDPGGDTGLGLPFCKLAVERMGGRISLTSSPGLNTVFTVTLPAARG